MTTHRSKVHEDASRAIRADLLEWGISQRQAAKQLGIANSTFNASLNKEFHTQHQATLQSLLAYEIWSEDTRRHLQKLLDYESLVFRGQLAGISLRVIQGGKQ